MDEPVKEPVDEHVADPSDERGDLRGDCARCAGLCCVALPFARSQDFAASKPAGRPCLNLATGPQDFRCTIHTRLRASGWSGCTVFDCFGAGQLVTQDLFDGRTWRSDPQLAPKMFAAFEGMRRVQETRYYLHSLRDEPLSPDLRVDLTALDERAAKLARLRTGEAPDTRGPSPGEVQALHEAVAPALRAASAQLRAGPGSRGAGRSGRARGAPPRIRAGADLVGADLSGLDLTGAELRGALLVAADLRDATLVRADLLGADLRDARLAGADLRGALFVTPPQLAAATGDDRTRLPAGLAPPAHWLPG